MVSIARLLQDDKSLPNADLQTFSVVFSGMAYDESVWAGRGNQLCVRVEELRVVGQLERPDPVRLQTVCLPNPVNRRGAQPLRGRHRAQAPVRRLGRRRVQCGLHHLLRAGGGDVALAATARRGSGRRAPAGDTAAPHAYGILARGELLGDVLARPTVSREQHDPAPQHHPLRRGAGSNPAFQRRTLFSRHWQGWDSVHAVHRTKPQLEVQEDSRSVH